MSSDKYILNDDGNPCLEPDLLKWAMWFEHNQDKRVVAQIHVGDVKVSTVFLGLDHSFSISGVVPPVLWETMVFGGKLDQEMDRCSGSREQAEAMHRDMLDRVLKSLKTE